MSYSKNFSSIKAFLPNKQFFLKIIEYGQLNYTPDNWMIWFDIYGNKLTTDRHKNISIILNTNINPQTISSKDLYSKADFKKIASMTKFALISLKEDIYYIWTLDINNILRLSVYSNDLFIENQPILNSGISNLKKIISLLDVDGFVEVLSIVEPLGSEVMKSWATQWPPPNDLLNMIPDIIKKDCSLA